MKQLLLYIRKINLDLDMFTPSSFIVPALLNDLQNGCYAILMKWRTRSLNSTATGCGTAFA